MNIEEAHKLISDMYMNHVDQLDVYRLHRYIDELHNQLWWGTFNAVVCGRLSGQRTPLDILSVIDDATEIANATHNGDQQ